ncbi:unnamed protein product, partial [Ectocarpus fasciculatus]
MIQICSQIRIKCVNLVHTFKHMRLTHSTTSLTERPSRPQWAGGAQFEDIRNSQIESGHQIICEGVSPRLYETTSDVEWNEIQCDSPSIQPRQAPVEGIES